MKPIFVRKLAIIAAFLTIGATPLSASDTQGDAAAGESKATTCAACHGAGGHSLNPAWPNLADQHVNFIVEQLQAFKSGKRKNILMNAQAMGLSEQDMLDLAAYYAEQPAQVRTVANAESVDVARRLYVGGDTERGIPACIACHGPDGAGNPGVPYPSLSSQHATYLASSLREYAAANGNRNNTKAQNQMVTIASKLTPAEIEALGSYMQGLH